jgi:hypothetical protein
MVLIDGTPFPTGAVELRPGRTAEVAATQEPRPIRPPSPSGRVVDFDEKAAASFAVQSPI